MKLHHEPSTSAAPAGMDGFVIPPVRQAQAELNAWFPLVYAELHKLASAYLRSEAVGHTLQTTSLVHEVYVRLIGQRSVGWQDRRGFFAAAGTAMRRILVDHARAKRTRKRGGGCQRVSIDDISAPLEERAHDLVSLGDALDRLAAMDARKALIVDLRFFVGLPVDETAAVLGLSPRTVARDWDVARAWLFGEIERLSGAEERSSRLIVGNHTNAQRESGASVNLRGLRSSR